MLLKKLTQNVPNANPLNKYFYHINIITDYSANKCSKRLVIQKTNKSKYSAQK